MNVFSFFWALLAMLQCCAISKIGKQQLKHNWLTIKHENIMVFTTFICFLLSFYINCFVEGISVGSVTWFFIIVTTSYFIQMIVFYFFRHIYIYILFFVFVCCIVSTIYLFFYK